MAIWIRYSISRSSLNLLCTHSPAIHVGHILSLLRGVAVLIGHIPPRPFPVLFSFCPSYHFPLSIPSWIPFSRHTSFRHPSSVARKGRCPCQSVSFSISLTSTLPSSLLPPSATASPCTTLTIHIADILPRLCHKVAVLTGHYLLHPYPLLPSLFASPSLPPVPLLEHTRPSYELPLSCGCCTRRPPSSAARIRCNPPHLCRTSTSPLPPAFHHCITLAISVAAILPRLPQ